MGTTVILPDFVLPSRVNQRWQYSGIDSIEHCLNKDHFQSYPYSIEYVYNSRGYRDAEWPDTLDELKRAIWCFGDSFTVGVGQALEHTWPQVLSKKLNRRIINVSMDGASNDWIYRKINRIIEIIDPMIIVVLWSYTHRTEHHCSDLDDEQRRLLTVCRSRDQDYLHWKNLSDQLKTAKNQIIQATIPGFHQGGSLKIDQHWDSIKGESWPCSPRTLSDLLNLPEYIKQELMLVHGCYEHFVSALSNDASVDSIIDQKHLMTIEKDNRVIYIKHQIDSARDGHHFGPLTSEWFVDQLLTQLHL